MNVTFKPVPAQPTLKEHISVNGKEYGYIQQSEVCGDENRFMAVINLDINESFPHCIYGHGATKEAAIENALTRGSDAAAAMLIAIDRLQGEIA